MTNQLFQENPNEVEEMPIQDGVLRLYPHIFSPEEKEAFFNQLKENGISRFGLGNFHFFQMSHLIFSVRNFSKMLVSR